VSDAAAKRLCIMPTQLRHQDLRQCRPVVLYLGMCLRVGAGFEPDLPPRARDPSRRALVERLSRGPSSRAWPGRSGGAPARGPAPLGPGDGRDRHPLVEGLAGSSAYQLARHVTWTGAGELYRPAGSARLTPPDSRQRTSANPPPPPPGDNAMNDTIERSQPTHLRPRARLPAPAAGLARACQQRRLARQCSAPC